MSVVGESADPKIVTVAVDSIVLEDHVNPCRTVCRQSDGQGVFVAAQGLHSNVFEKAVIRTIDPSRCVSISRLRSRPLCRWGVQMIKDSITGQGNVESFVHGYVSTGKFPVLVAIPDDGLGLLEEHFIEDGKGPEEAATLAKSGIWFHAVDGGHLHGGLMLAIKDFSETFGGFKWPVVVIPWQSEDTLRSISRMANEMQKDTHLIDFTLPDVMQNLRDIIDIHSNRTGVAVVPGKKVKNGLIKEVIGIYAGQPGYADNTMRNLCGVVLKLSSRVVRAIRALLTEECDDYCKRLGSNKPFGNDTRVYKKLMSSQSLKGTKSFLSHKAMSDEDRINVVHRLRFLARERESFKPFQSSEIERLSRCVIEARSEMLKFERFLAEEPWPKEMDNLRRNVFQTTLLDGEVKEHIGSEGELLPALVDAYVRATGAHGTQKLSMFRRRMAACGTGSSARESRRESESSGEGSGSGSDVLSERGQNRNRDEEGANVSAEEDNEANQECDQKECNAEEVAGETNTEPEEDPNLFLENCGINVRSMSVLKFERESVAVESVFDFVIADPFQKVPIDDREDVRSHVDELVDEKGINLYIQCLRRLLVAGGYCFIFLDWDRLQQWTSCTTNSQFEIVCEPFLVIKDVKRIQRMTLKGPQSVYDPAIVIKKPGRHPKGFSVDKKSPYVHLPSCRMPRWCNVIDGVPPPAQRLTFKPSRAQVRPNERPCALFIEIFQTFCPEGGSILDPSAGVLTTGLACISTNRSCVLLESDERCLSYALPRLQEFAKAKVSENCSSVLTDEEAIGVEVTSGDSHNEGREHNQDEGEGIQDEDEDSEAEGGNGSHGDVVNEKPVGLKSSHSDRTGAPSSPSNVAVCASEGDEFNASASMSTPNPDKRNNDIPCEGSDKLELQGTSLFSEISSEGSVNGTGQLDDHSSRTPQRTRTESRTVITQKRSRALRASAESCATPVQQTPSSYRRSKRTRRPVQR